MDKTYKFPSIVSLRQVVKSVQHRAWYTGSDEHGNPIYDKSRELPTLSYRGSVKLHGTNGGIIFGWNPLEFQYDYQVQSRTRIITPTDDNAGFATFVSGIDLDELLGLITKSMTLDYTPETIRVYGEWCGGNIQKGVGINKVEKMFVIFSIKIDDVWVPDDVLSQVKLPSQRVFNIVDFTTYNIEIDFSNLDEAATKLAELTNSVEAECPVAKSFGIQDGVGEGIVWVTKDEGWDESKFWFKDKGEKHSVSGKGNKNKVAIDVEKVNSINELVDKIVAEPRLLQGIEYLKENNMETSRKNLGAFLKWVNEDVVKEENDTITENGFTHKEISKYISNKSRSWFFANELTFD